MKSFKEIISNKKNLTISFYNKIIKFFLEMQKLVLGYYDTRGRAQPRISKSFYISIVRYLLEYIGADYEDKRYIDPAQWFGKDKLLFKENPLVNLPYLKDGNKVNVL
jgi:hypothetical protein